MNEFLNKILTNKDKNMYNKAYESIVNNIIIENKHGREKAMGLDEYNSETNSKLTFIPGHIYTFKYITDKPTVYDNGHIKFEYYDKSPIILCTNYTDKIIKGINLNFCNKGLKTLILNDIYNIDLNFFEKEASIQAHNNQLPISKRISQYFKNNESDFLNRITQKYKVKNIGFIYRTYNIQKIKNVRFIEPYQWQYMPYLNYNENIKESTLKLIQDITKINNIKIQ